MRPLKVTLDGRTYCVFPDQSYLDEGRGWRKVSFKKHRAILQRLAARQEAQEALDSYEEARDAMSAPLADAVRPELARE